jgi:transmembrane sensor
MSLASFAAELGRYRPGLLRCDPEVAQLEVSGAFQLHDTDQALHALTQVLPVEIRYRTRYWVTIAPISS